jgi:hypothetical protein
MRSSRRLGAGLATAFLLLCWTGAGAQRIDQDATTKWVTVTAESPGTDTNAKDEAVARALRKAVEEACGVFLKARSTTEDYQAVYDKVFADTVGYVREHKVLKVWTEADVTFATVRACVSSQRFEQDWAAIAHTVEQENNPRMIVAIAEAIHWSATSPSYEVERNGTVQGKIEDFLLQKGIVLVDKETAGEVAKRDILLAVIKDDAESVAALGAQFRAEVVVMGRATAKFGRTLDVAGQEMYQYTATLNVRVVQTDSARILAVKSYGPTTVTVLQYAGGEEKALAKLADEAAPKLLAAVVEAWARRANVSRTVQLAISGMDHKSWKAFRDEAVKIPGVQALRLRDITENMANIDVEYRYTNENLADKVSSLKTVRLEITEITANRIKLKLLEVTTQPSD